MTDLKLLTSTVLANHVAKESSLFLSLHVSTQAACRIQCGPAVPSDRCADSRRWPLHRSCRTSDLGCCRRFGKLMDANTDFLLDGRLRDGNSRVCLLLSKVMTSRSLPPPYHRAPRVFRLSTVQDLERERMYAGQPDGA